MQISALVAGLENLTETHPSSASLGQRTATHNARAARVAIMEFEALMRMLDNRVWSPAFSLNTCRIWYGMVWYGMVWCYMVSLWYGMVLHGMTSLGFS